MAKGIITKTVSCILVTTGVLLVGYPVFLRVRARWEQACLAREYAEHPPYLEVDWSPAEEPDPAPGPPQWDELPPTLLEIPAIGLSVHLEAVEDMDIFARKLSQQPSYYPQSSMPGQVGNVLIAGHRGGPAGYFGQLKNLKPGEEIILRVPGASYYYEVEEVFKVPPTAVEVLDPQDYGAITLTTCYSSTHRLIVRGRFREYIPDPEP
jgi:LPXTG-site transpeptidase (sortase) family protein